MRPYFMCFIILEMKLRDLPQQKNCKIILNVFSFLKIFLKRYGRGWKYHYPTESWIQDQNGEKKYFNNYIWMVKTLQESDIAEDEFVTLNEFKQHSAQ